MEILNMANGAGLDLAQIADLTTQVATTGALRLTELVTDQVFEFTVGVVVLTDAVWGG